MEISVWSKAWGLPSFDSKCLSVMAFCKMSNIPVTYIETGNPWKSPSYDLPFLQEEKKKIAGMQEIIDYCCKNKIGNGDSCPINSQYLAYNAWLEEKLNPALEHYFWVDSKNFTDFIRPWYAKATVFPLSMFIPTNKNATISSKLFYQFGEKFVSDLERENMIYKDAKECINLLSLVLDKKEYFGGENPSAIDALVFGYLAPLIKAPFPNTNLQQHVKNCSNLTLFCQRVLDKFFPLNKKETEELEKSEETRKEKERATCSDFPNRRRNVILGGVLAVSTMVVYAFASGMIEIQVEDDVDDNTKNNSDSNYDNFYSENNEKDSNES